MPHLWQKFNCLSVGPQSWSELYKKTCCFRFHKDRCGPSSTSSRSPMPPAVRDAFEPGRSHEIIKKTTNEQCLQDKHCNPFRRQSS